MLSIMGLNSKKVSSHWKSEQHHGALPKPSKEWIWANHFGLFLRDKPRYLVLGMAGDQGRDCDHLPWEADRLIFHVNWYPLFRTVSFVWDCLGVVFSQMTFVPYFSLYERPWPVNVVLGLTTHCIGNRQLRVSYSPEHWVLCRPPCFVSCFNEYGLLW